MARSERYSLYIDLLKLTVKQSANKCNNGGWPSKING